ncbi:hypothetical protein GQX73_g9542 [Xylaria multiplex]|uniref:Xylanolytic transcriptional activator regulatory domain-containing protein n=1 Tax=Xylaria multiplex TaxID=323545 RepID=A0A7C8IHW0_9PEZI|nr:hypothetical protein GQX73_g9542 [Xylaria multiplex]
MAQGALYLFWKWDCLRYLDGHVVLGVRGLAFPVGARKFGCIYSEPIPSAQITSPQSTSTEGDEHTEIIGNLGDLVDVYFDRVYPLPSHAFLHPANTKERCREGKADQALAYAICALATWHSQPDQNARVRADAWSKTAENILLRHLESPTISRLQALLLTINYQMQAGLFQRAFMLTATAARYAAAMRLNHERPDLDPITQEVRRRIIWSLKIIERYFSVGLPEFEAFHIETIYLRFPCSESDFGCEVSGGDDGAYSLFVQLELIRREIMKLTRAVSLCEQPYDPLIKLIAELKGSLDKVALLLSSNTSHASLLTSVDGEGGLLSIRQVFAHISFHQANCDLYRILLKGYPEAAPCVVLDAVDKAHAETAQYECLKHASAIVQILTNLNHNSKSVLLLEFDTAICTYHAVRLILFIARSDHNVDGPTPEFAASRADLCLVAMRRFFAHSALAQPIIDDIERLKEGLAPEEAVVGGLTSPPEFQEGRRNMEQQLSEAAKARQRLAIHSLLRRADFTDDGEGG